MKKIKKVKMENKKAKEEEEKALISNKVVTS